MSEHEPSQEYPTAFPPQGIVPPPETPGFPQEAAMYPASPITPAAPKGFAITGMVVGITGIAMFFVPFWGPIVSLVGLIFGIVARVNRQPRVLSFAGIITGSVGIVIGLSLWIWIFVWAAQTVQQTANDPAIQRQFEELLEREAAQFE